MELKVDPETGLTYESNIDEFPGERFKQCKTEDCPNETVVVLPNFEDKPPYRVRYEALCRPCWKIEADILSDLVVEKFAAMGILPSLLEDI